METPDDLCEYISQWLARYPNLDAAAAENEKAQSDEDNRVGRFARLSTITQDDARELIRWKFQSMAPRRNKALKGVDDDHWPVADQLLVEALSQDGDLPPLLTLGNVRNGIYGWGPAMSSVVLAVCHPSRFTIADTRALGTLRVLGFDL